MKSPADTANWSTCSNKRGLDKFIQAGRDQLDLRHRWKRPPFTVQKALPLLPDWVSIILNASIAPDKRVVGVLEALRWLPWRHRCHR